MIVNKNHQSNFMPPTMSIHHIGIVVQDALSAALEYMKMACANECTPLQDIPNQKVKACLVTKANMHRVEFIEPSDKDSPVYFFSLNGGGIHHICYETDNLDQCIVALRPFARMLGKPKCGFDGRKTAFLFIKNALMGMRLIEIAEW